MTRDNKRSPITQQLVQRLRDMKEGEFITYEELSQVANCDIKGRLRYFFETAYKIAKKEYSIVLECEANKGFRRLKNEEISKYANTLHTKRMVSDTTSYKKKVECVNPTKLTLSQRIDYGLSMAYLGLREALSNKETEQVLRQRIIRSPDQMIDKQVLREDLRSFK